MKNNTYRNAVNHLQFSQTMPDILPDSSVQKFSCRRFWKMAAFAAVMVCMVFTTAFATSAEFRNWTISFLNLGVSQTEMPEVEVMKFHHEAQADGVTMHYMELDRNDYLFSHGIIYNDNEEYFRITDDYQVETLDMKPISASLEKNGREYHNLKRYYLETDEGIFTSMKYILQKNAQGEIFQMLTDGNSNQWPVYVNLETGAVRDALPNWSTDDFQGRVIYAYELRGGILVATIVAENKVVNGNSVAYNKLYWIGEDTEEPIIIEMPDKEYGWYCENDNLYCKNIQGHLFWLNENFEFELICAYETGDDLSNGLYTVATENQELAIVDVYTGDTYVISGYTVDPGRPSGYRGREGGDLDETTGLNAIRYHAGSKIALVHTEISWKAEKVALKKLGILDTATNELRFLEIENNYDGYRVAWLDENRLAVIYDAKYLCIYEFE